MAGPLGFTLLVALGAALVLGAVAARFRLPPMVGYLVAGVAVGPFTPGFVADAETMRGLADVGVALLMFTIGLRFSLRQLISSGRRVLIGAPLQVALVVAAGTMLGVAIGWSLLEALFLGAIAAVSSSVVLVKLAGDAGAQDTRHGRFAFSWSIVQDLLTVGLIVILSALAHGGEESPLLSVAAASGIALAFLGLLAVGGQIVFPRVLAGIARWQSRELFLLAVAILALGSASTATLLGVSLALGAFVAGVALADSDLTPRVLGDVVPLRELFAAMFFVSVGGLVDPAVVLADLPLVALIVGLIVGLKGSVIVALGLALRTPAATIVLSAALLAQAGEFSFLLAALGRQQGVLSETTFSILLGAVIASMLAAVPVYRAARWLAVRMRWTRDQHPGLPDPALSVHGHAIIGGWGRLGRQLGRILGNRGFPVLAVDADYNVVEEARQAEGAAVLFGNVGSRDVLDEARVADAHLLVITVPDALAAYQAVRYARDENRRLFIVVRAQGNVEEQDLRRAGADEVVVEARQLSTRLATEALARFGISGSEARRLLASLRDVPPRV